MIMEFKWFKWPIQSSWHPLETAAYGDGRQPYVKADENDMCPSDLTPIGIGLMLVSNVEGIIC